jgi:hypothetical protein
VLKYLIGNLIIILAAEGGSENDDVINQLKKEVAELKAQVEQSKQSSLVCIVLCVFCCFSNL